MSNKTQIAAIDFGTSKIVTVIAENAGIDQLSILGTGTVPYDGFMNGDWNTPNQMIKRVHDSIAAAELEANQKIKEIYVGVPGEFIHVLGTEAEVELTEAGATEEDKDAVQDAAAEKLRIAELGGMVLHRSPAWFQIDNGKKTISVNGHGQTLRAYTSFVVADMNFIEDIKEMMAYMDITILGFLSPTLGEAMLLLGVDERDRAGVVIDCGYLNTEISVIHGDALLYHAVLPMGGGHITADLAQQLRIPMRAAEQIKRNYVFNPDEFDRDSVSEVFDSRGRRLTFPRESVNQIIERSMNELCGKIDKTLEMDTIDLLSSRSQIFLTGGGISLMRGGKDYLSSRINKPVKASAAKTAKMNSPVYSSIMGLVDLTMDSIERREDNKNTIGRKLGGVFRKR